MEGFCDSSKALRRSCRGVTTSLLSSFEFFKFSNNVKHFASSSRSFSEVETWQNEADRGTTESQE